MVDRHNYYKYILFCVFIFLAYSIVAINQYGDTIYETISKSRWEKQQPLLKQKDEEVHQEELTYSCKNTTSPERPRHQDIVF